MESFRSIVGRIVVLEDTINAVPNKPSRVSELRAELDELYDKLLDSHLWPIIPGKDTDHEPSISEL